MKLAYNVNSDCKLELEVKGVKEAFQLLAYMQSVFGVKRCGNCESPNLTLCHRQPQGYDYYSVQCQDCKHELKFGQAREGNKLFPKGWEQPYQDGESQPQTTGRGPRREDDYGDSNERGQGPVGAGNSTNGTHADPGGSIPW